MSFISLQGEEQAKLINQLLLERLKPEEIEHRDLVCGDAYAFQGDERDVMFLSMVAAPNERIGALTKESDKQRFNVAASRARDQVWLFHTATLNELNPGCMRHKLLGYYSNPAAQPVGKPDWDKCESNFERDVGRIIYARNYRLIPQYEPFGPRGYRIDFVVEGLKARLAVECDGPHHDDPEQIEHDMFRQRQLERCGCIFWRVAESKFRFEPDSAMASLWVKLAELGILPQNEVTPSAAEPPPTPRTPSPDEKPTITIPAPVFEGFVVPRLPTKPIIVPRDFAVPIQQSELPLAPNPTSRLTRHASDLDPIAKFVLDQLAVPKRLETNALILDTVRRLGLGSDGRVKIEKVIRSLENSGLITVGPNYIGKKDTYG